MIALACVLALLLCCCAPGSEQRPQPLIWEVTADGMDGTFFLFGSIHVADAALYPLDPLIMQSFEACDLLAVECDLLAYQEDPHAQIEVLSVAAYKDDRTVADDLGEELYAEITALLRAYDPGLSFELLDLYKPFMWESALAQIAAEKAGLSSDYGLDMFFMQEARDRGMEILEVESTLEQVQMFNDFPMELQTMMLRDYLDLASAADATAVLYRLWKAGDAEELERYLTEDDPDPEDTALLEEYNRVMITERNVRMAEAAAQYIGDGKSVFYVVGLAHMLGEDGIVNLLRQDGYTVTQLKYS